MDGWMDRWTQCVSDSISNPSLHNKSPQNVVSSNKNKHFFSHIKWVRNSRAAWLDLLLHWSQDVSQDCSYLKAWLWLEDPVPRRLPPLAGTWVLGAGRRPQFLPTWASPQAAWASSSHGSWPPSEWEREPGRTRGCDQSRKSLSSLPPRPAPRCTLLSLAHISGPRNKAPPLPFEGQCVRELRYSWKSRQWPKRFLKQTRRASNTSFYRPNENTLQESIHMKCWNNPDQSVGWQSE